MITVVYNRAQYNLLQLALERSSVCCVICGTYLNVMRAQLLYMYVCSTPSDKKSEVETIDARLVVVWFKITSQ